MSGQLPVRVNPFRLVEQKRRLSGVLSSSSLPRLQTAVVEGCDVRVTVDLAFERDETAGAPALTVSARADLPLACQRCLGKVVESVDTRSQLLLIEHESEAEQFPGMETLLIEDDELTIAELVEDEVLLAIPMVPMHDSVAQCEQQVVAEFTAQDVSEPEAERGNNPFSVLKALKDDDESS